MEKLRLLFTEKCDRNCKLCVNKNFSINDLPVVDHLNYSEIIITGGEPLLFLDELIGFIKGIRITYKGKIYLNTAKPPSFNDTELIKILPFVDGITLTLHTKIDVIKFVNYLFFNPTFWEGKSMRLVLFDGLSIRPEVNLKNWNLKQITWLEDCPLPEGEEFKRINIY